ncbi:MAG: single-stranded-DNA-specific exonuclease RecJ [Clostridiales bacterium]|uniref:single-stranded-DNA-specific exonuclease RecJ n=1 Tax=Terrisporobacter sp. TaxID=1965305 RepID=UPI002A567893|nr:single-stranded-DNA-specific exonuclease RecJ [Terrisporobacter sp.]MDD7754449.1 single-stranded-DNA-specific exonuclease RecJ [Clostridiales bacterium]MDY4135390.1 single-stranded-DNA-specific exonuclease RecJ [Terrisporobacter sp.]
MIYNKKWTLKYKGEVKETNLSKKINISPEISQILNNRGIENEKDAEIFMNPSLEYLRDPFLMKDMKKSTERIKKAIENKERIYIYGDYDVDGVSSTSILYLYFKSIGFPVKYYIPNRLEEGYGINEDAIKKIHDDGCDLIITVDCGITSVKEVELANELGIDVIITDHHECQSEIPDAYAIVNPKQEDCNYPFDMLCGCGVAFKMIQALTDEEEFKTSMFDYLEIVTLATICDIVPLIDENRIIVKNGLKLMKEGKNLGLRELIKVCGIETNKIGSSHIGFSIGPRINASGRLGYSYLGVQLFTTDNEDEAKEIANILEGKNIERQMIESKMYKEAEEILSSDERFKDDKVLVIAKEGWQHGIIGIVASKLTEKYYKPTILLTIEDGEATGSARSIKGFSIFDALVSCKDLMNKFGGHEQAAGLALDAKNIDELRVRINEIADYNLSKEDLIENIKVEYELKEDSATLDLVDNLHKLEPFGLSNPSPRFIMRDLLLTNIFKMGKNKQHLKIIVENKKSYECVGFNMAYLADNFQLGDKVDILFQVDENNYNNERKVQFLLKDIRLSHPKSAVTNNLSMKLFEKISPENKDSLYSVNTSEEDLVIDIDGDKNINIFDYIEEDTLVITNTLNGFYRALSDISLTDVEYEINFNYINEKNNKVQLIFSPNIDKIDLKRYNRVILYDYLYNKEEYSYLNKNILNSDNIIKYYGEEDKIYLKNIIDNIVPSREEFINIYKQMLMSKELHLNLDEIKRVFKILPLKTFIILKVFKELNLLNFEMNYEDNTVTICLLQKPDKKLNLDESLILNNLKALKQEYVKSY